MRRLLLTLPTPAENLALDEALLDLAEEEGSQAEFVRVWESPDPVVVVGRASRVNQEVDLKACDARGIPVLRRSSGGAAIVAGPGCLMYAVVLSYALRPESQDIRRAHAYVLGRIAEALNSRLAGRGRIMVAGTSDLALAVTGVDIPRKFSGNSLRAKRTHLLYHGTLLYDFDLSLIATCLRMPPRQPEYRDRREHRQFVTNLPLGLETLTEAVLAAWPTVVDAAAWPDQLVKALVVERFSQENWNLGYGEAREP